MYWLFHDNNIIDNINICYIVWTPSSYYDLHYKAKVLIGCAYYYAFLASLILTCVEIDYAYKYNLSK